MTTTHHGHRKVGPWATWRRFWPVAIIIPLATTAAGVTLTSERPPVYRAEARLAVGAGEMNALSIPGFPQAAEEMAADYARWVSHQGVEGQLQREGVGFAASPITDSSVIRIEAYSVDPEKARAGAQDAAEHLMEAVNEVTVENDPERVLDQIQDLVPVVTEARQATEVAQQEYLRAVEEELPESTVDERFEEYAAAETRLATQDLQLNGLRDRYRNLVSSRTTESDLRVIRSAEVIDNDAEPVRERNALLGFALGVIVVAIVMAALDRWRQTHPPRPSRRERRAAAAAAGPGPSGSGPVPGSAGSTAADAPAEGQDASRPPTERNLQDRHVDLAASSRD